MTQLPVSDTSRRMGRPPLKVKATLVRLAEDAGERIDALVGKNRRAEFIRYAVEKELKLLERSKRKNVDGTTPKG